MSLIPYHPREGREIVLRHNNAIVVRDPSSQRLEIRGLSECPTCHRPMRSPSPERQYDIPSFHDSYVDPDYFRMLRAGGGHGHDNAEHIHHDRPPPSPVRRLVPPVQDAATAAAAAVAGSVDDAEFVSSTPRIQEGSRIRREAFSPNYFKTFFVEERELGRGGKGVVLLVRHEIDGCHLGYFACKRVPVGDDHAWLEKVLVEVELLAKLSHPNLVSYRHVWLEDVKLNRFGPSVVCAFILQQYCNSGDLLHFVVGSQPRQATKEELKAQMRRRSKGQAERPENLFAGQRQLPFEEIFSLFKDITSGLAYLHAANYVHRDLKPSNCLLHREGRIMTCLISDFGEVQPENMVRKSTGSTGTISYCAPEVLKKDGTGRFGNFTTKSDIFSLGMILYFMCFNRLPYRSANSIQEELEDIDQLRAEIIDWKGFQDERRERPDLPSALYQLLKRLLAINPVDRPSASEVLSAMKSESGLDGVTRAARSSSPPIGLTGRRIQNLDSPVPPGTPVPEPTKQGIVPMAAALSQNQARDGSAISSDEGSPQPGSHNSLQRHPDANGPRHRASVMSVSRSQEDYTRRPSRNNNEVIVDNDGVSSSGTPLLMAPPATFVGEVRHALLLARHRVIRLLLQQDGATLSFIFRLLLFFAKIASLAQPCWPYTVDLSAGAFLILIAGLDLGVPDAGGGPPVRELSWLQPGLEVGQAAAANAYAPRSRWRWDWRVSLGLFVFHIVAIWSMARRGVLCAVPREGWMAEPIW